MKIYRAVFTLFTFNNSSFSFAFSFFSAKGETRQVKLDEDFFTGYRKTILGPSEVLINILVPFTEEVKKETLYQMAFFCLFLSCVVR